MNDHAQTIKELIENVLKKLCVDFDEVSFLVGDGFQKGTRFLIKTGDSGILIGSEGATIYALNHLIKKMVWKKLNSGTNAGADKKINFFVDVNDYQGQNIEKIKTQALNLVEKVNLFKRDIEMEPMSSYERMVVHTLLADESNVFTESIGEGDFRRLVIKTRQK